MTQDNPYQAPAANVVVAGDADVKQPRAVPIGRGVTWLSAGWQYFKANPGPWLGATAVWAIIMIVVSMIPLVNWASGIIGPVFVAGFMIGCVRQDGGGQFQFDDLFAGFRDNPTPLLLVGLIQLIAVVVVFFLVGVVGAGLFFATGGAEVFENPEAMLSSGSIFAVAIVVLLALALSLPIAMASWFAPVLVVDGKKAPLEAMLLSIRGCLKNVLPFLPYGLLLMLLAIPVLLTLGLALIVVMPMTTASVYVAYKDIFLHNSSAFGTGGADAPADSAVRPGS